MTKEITKEITNEQVWEKLIEIDQKINKLYGLFAKVDNVQRWLEPTNQWGGTNNQLLQQILANTVEMEAVPQPQQPPDIQEFHPVVEQPSEED